MDTDQILADCADDVELLKKHAKGLTKTYDLSIALDRAIRHRYRLVERIEQLWKIVEVNCET